MIPDGDPLDPTTRWRQCACLVAKARIARVEQLLGRPALPPALRRCTFAMFNAFLAPGPYEACAAWKPGAGSLLLYGPPGTGKTHLAAAIANQWLGRAEVALVPTPDLFALLFRDGPAGERLVDELRAVQVLILDDLGQADEHDAAWRQELRRRTAFRILNHREQAGLDLIATSNMQSVAAFSAAMGEAAASRLFGMTGKAGRLSFRGLADHRLSETQM